MLQQPTFPHFATAMGEPPRDRLNLKENWSFRERAMALLGERRRDRTKGPHADKTQTLLGNGGGNAMEKEARTKRSF